MKFKEIPQYTSIGSYQIHVSLKYLLDTMHTYINEYHLLMDPDFQRGHVWTVSQQIKFVQFLLRGGKSMQPIYFNCPEWQKGKVKDFVIVDGLQRITACTRFLENIIPAFGIYYQDFEDTLPSTEPFLIFNINNLKTRKEVLMWYLELNEGGTPHSDKELGKVRRLLMLESKKSLV